MIQPEVALICEEIISACENFPHRMEEHPSRIKVFAQKILQKVKTRGKVSFNEYVMIIEIGLLTEKWIE